MGTGMVVIRDERLLQGEGGREKVGVTETDW
jgi:hypothetical protein